MLYAEEEMRKAAYKGTSIGKLLEEPELSPAPDSKTKKCTPSVDGALQEKMGITQVDPACQGQSGSEEEKKKEVEAQQVEPRRSAEECRKEARAGRKGMPN